MAMPRMIFSWLVSCAYASISSVRSDGRPTISMPSESPAASPATALSVYITSLSASYAPSSSVPSSARPRPRQAPCCVVSLPVLRRLSRRNSLMPAPWFAWISPSAYSAPPSL